MMRFVSAVVIVGVASLGGVAGAGQNQPLRGGVRQTNGTPPVPDVFASGCGGTGYAETGDCAKLKAYVDQGGHDPTCLQLWRQAISLDKQIEALSSRANENTNPRLSQMQGELAKKLSEIERQIDMKCVVPCDLRTLAYLVFRQYGRDKPPIAIYRVSNLPQPTYLIALQGLEHGVVGDDDAAQAWLSGARGPQFALAYNILKLTRGEDKYRAAILDAVQGLPRGANLILAGHSAGGIEAQNLVPEISRRGFRVNRVITYGSPVTADKMASTQYTYVKSLGDPIAFLDQRYDLTSTLTIPAGPNSNPFAEDGGSHFFYPDSRELADRSRGICFSLVLFGTYGISNQDPFPCGPVSFAGLQPVQTEDPWRGNSPYKQAMAAKWRRRRRSERQTMCRNRSGRPA